MKRRRSGSPGQHLNFTHETRQHKKRSYGARWAQGTPVYPSLRQKVRGSFAREQQRRAVVSPDRLMPPHGHGLRLTITVATTIWALCSPSFHSHTDQARAVGTNSLMHLVSISLANSLSDTGGQPGLLLHTSVLEQGLIHSLLARPNSVSPKCKPKLTRRDFARSESIVLPSIRIGHARRPGTQQ